MRRSLLPIALVCTIAGEMLLSARGEEVAPGVIYSTELAKQFAGWDGNQDGFLTVAEADRAIADAKVREAGAATAVTVRQTLLRAKAERMSLEEAQKNAGAAKTFGWALKRLQQAPRVLYVNGVPRAESLRQGKLGDCFCLAGLRAVLERDPGALGTMIQPQGDGSFRVKIGAQDVAVPAVTDGEIILGASADDGLWPLVYEKAVGLFRTKESDRSSTPFAVVTRGGSAGAMMAKLTANEIKRWSGKPWRDAAGTPEKQAALLQDLRGQLQGAFAEKRLVTTGTGARPETGAVAGVTYSHGYTVLGYDAARDEVRLWNPHGNSFKPKGEPGLVHGYPRTKGEWSVPLAEAVTFLAGFAFEQRAGGPAGTKGVQPSRVAAPAEAETTAPAAGR